jgi:hypothetical protein
VNARSIVVPISALVAWGLWFSEIYWLKGWGGLDWLKGFHWSALPICAVIALASSVTGAERTPLWRRLAFSGVAGAAMFAAFVVFRDACYDFYTTWAPDTAGRAVVRGLTAAVALPIGLAAAARGLLAPGRRRAYLPIGVALLVTPLFSKLSLFALSPLIGGSSEFDEIKMGYPVLWLAALVPGALWSSAGGAPAPVEPG